MSNAAPPKNTGLFDKAIRGILRPLVRAMIANGVTAPAFYRIVKQAYVDVACETLGPDATGSRVSVMTGVHRRDVKDMRANQDDSAQTIRRKVSILSTVVGRWLGNDDTTDATGTPLPLQRSGGDGVSFETLVQSISQDVRPRTILDELMRQNAVFVDGDVVHLNVEAFVGPADQDHRVHFFAHNVGDHLNAAVENLLHDTPPHFERAVFYNALSDESVTAIEQDARRLGTEALLSVNKHARALQQQDVDADQGSNRFRFGIFFYREDESGVTKGQDEL